MMAKSSCEALLVLLFVSLALLSPCGVNGEVNKSFGDRNARRLMQQARERRPVPRDGASSSATASATASASTSENGTATGASASGTASASTSENGTATAVSVAANCETVAARRTSGRAAVTASALAACGDDNAAPSPEESGPDPNEIGFRGEDDGKYCTLCPEESGCEVCCCYDGQCVDRKEAEEGTAFCTMVAAVSGGSPPSTFQCAYCQESGCSIYFHWCR